MKLDPFDRKIIAELQIDGRQTNLALAEKIGLSPTPCLRRVRRLEEKGLITGYTVAIDRKKAGLGLTVFVGIRVERHQDAAATRFVDTVTAWPEVIACHLVSGESDYLLEVVAADMEDYESNVLKRLLNIESVRDVRSNFAMRSHKTNGGLPL